MSIRVVSERENDVERRGHKTKVASKGHSLVGEGEASPTTQTKGGEHDAVRAKYWGLAPIHHGQGCRREGMVQCGPQTYTAMMARRAVYDFKKLYKVRGGRRMVDKGEGSAATGRRRVQRWGRSTRMSNKNAKASHLMTIGP